MLSSVTKNTFLGTHDDIRHAIMLHPLSRQHSCPTHIKASSHFRSSESATWFAGSITTKQTPRTGVTGSSDSVARLPLWPSLAEEVYWRGPVVLWCQCLQAAPNKFGSVSLPNVSKITLLACYHLLIIHIQISVHLPTSPRTTLGFSQFAWTRFGRGKMGDHKATLDDILVAPLVTAPKMMSWN